MDEALAEAAIDISGRAHLAWSVEVRPRAARHHGHPAVRGIFPRLFRQCAPDTLHITQPCRQQRRTTSPNLFQGGGAGLRMAVAETRVPPARSRPRRAHCESFHHSSPGRGAVPRADPRRFLRRRRLVRLALAAVAPRLDPRGAGVRCLLALARWPRPRRPRATLLGVVVLQGLLGRDLVRWSLARRGYRRGPRGRCPRPGRGAGPPAHRTRRSAEQSRCIARLMKIAVVDYGSGNLASAARALAAAAARAEIDADIAVTARPEQVAAADRIVLPGQGAFADCAARPRRAFPGCAMRSTMRRGRPPVPRHLRRHAADGRARPGAPAYPRLRLDPRRNRRSTRPALRLPHMGWNALQFEPGRHHLLDGLCSQRGILFRA